MHNKREIFKASLLLIIIVENCLKMIVSWNYYRNLFIIIWNARKIIYEMRNYGTINHG